MKEDMFDFIVTGAGSAGCAVAARLSEDGRYRVLLLEAGKRDSNPWIHIPIGFHKLYTHDTYNWRFESEPVAGLNGRTSYQPRGKMLGGTSSLNGMVYMRGTPADYDGWRQRGCVGWDYASVLPFFRKSEDQERGEDEFHGVGGPLRVSDQRFRNEIIDAVIEAAVQAGIPRNRRLQRRDAGGRWLLPGHDRQRPALERGDRLSQARAQPEKPRRDARGARDAPLDRERARRGHRVPHAARACRLRAAAARSWSRAASTARRNCCCCRGSGPGAHLREMGIDVRRDLPVGANLHDHFNSFVAWKAKKAVTLNDLARSPVRKLKAGIQYALGRQGPLSGTSTLAGILVRSDPRFDRPDLQFNISLYSIESAGPRRHHPPRMAGLHGSRRSTCSRKGAAA